MGQAFSFLERVHDTWCFEGWLCSGVMQRQEEGFNQKPLAETFWRFVPEQRKQMMTWTYPPTQDAIATTRIIRCLVGNLDKTFICHFCWVVLISKWWRRTAFVARLCMFFPLFCRSSSHFHVMRSMDLAFHAWHQVTRRICCGPGQCRGIFVMG